MEGEWGGEREERGGDVWILSVFQYLYCVLLHVHCWLSESGILVEQNKWRF